MATDGKVCGWCGEDPCEETCAWMLQARIEHLENLLAEGVHSCSRLCTRPMCVLRRRVEEQQALIQKMVDAWDNNDRAAYQGIIEEMEEITPPNGPSPS